jgi:hypothetical protein
VEAAGEAVIAGLALWLVVTATAPAPTVSPAASTPAEARDDDATLRATRLAHLRGHRMRWRAQGLLDYDITIRDTNCFCNFGPYYGPVRVSVRRGRISRTVYLGETRDGYRAGARLSIETHLKRTVDQLFDDAERVISSSDSQAWLRVEYDATYGFPTVIAFDRPDWEDEQSRVEVTDFVAYSRVPRKP